MGGWVGHLPSGVGDNGISRVVQVGQLRQHGNEDIHIRPLYERTFESRRTSQGGVTVCCMGRWVGGWVGGMNE